MLQQIPNGFVQLKFKYRVKIVLSRRRFAAMGLTIQMHQLDAYHENRSTWQIKDEVLG